MAAAPCFCGTAEPGSRQVMRKGYSEGTSNFNYMEKNFAAAGCWFAAVGSMATDERHWFLFKERDQFADPATDVIARKPLSVASDRDLDEIANRAERVWGPNGKVPPHEARRAASRANQEQKTSVA